MKWREVRNREMWYRGPTEGRTFFRATKARVQYTVQANWGSPMTRSGGVVWWSHDGNGNNTKHATKEAAMAHCEAKAGAGA